MSYCQMSFIFKLHIQNKIDFVENGFLGNFFGNLISETTIKVEYWRIITAPKGDDTKKNIFNIHANLLFYMLLYNLNLYT